MGADTHMGASGLVLDARSLLSRLGDELDRHVLPRWVAREVDDVRLILDEVQQILSRSECAT